MSNHANPNPINGNKRTTDDTVMNGSDILPTSTDTTPDPQDDMIDQTPTCIPFDTLSDSAQYKIKRLRTSISRNWNLASPASAFPGRYLPDPDTHNWGIHLLTTIDTLTELTRWEHRDEACARVIRHMKERNGLEGGMPDQGMLAETSSSRKGKKLIPAKISPGR